MNERVAIIGSRSGVPREVVFSYVRDLARVSVTVVSGRARRGVDSWAEEAAWQYGVPFDAVEAEWDRHGKIAGKMRNWPLVGGATRVQAFWDGWSNGTAHGVAAAVAQGVPAEVWLPTGFQHARADAVGAPGVPDIPEAARGADPDTNRRESAPDGGSVALSEPRRVGDQAVSGSAAHDGEPERDLGSESATTESEES